MKYAVLTIFFVFGTLFSASSQAVVLGGEQARDRLHAFLKLQKDQSIRLDSSIYFEPEYRDCDTVIINSDYLSLITISRQGKFAVSFEISEFDSDFDLNETPNKMIIHNARGVMLSLEKKLPSRSPTGQEIAISLVEDGVIIIKCLIVR